MKIFENVGNSFTCRRTKTEAFEHDDVMHHLLLAWRMLCEGCYLSYFHCLAFSYGRARTIPIRCVDAYFFENGRQKCPFSKNSSNPFRISIFLFLSYSFGSETINTFIHSRSSLENHTLFQTKTSKVYTRFQTKTAQKPYAMGRHIPI